MESRYDMSTRNRVGAYLVGLAVVFIGALGLGTAVEPVGPAAERIEAPAPPDVDHSDMDMNGGTGD